VTRCRLCGSGLGDVSTLAAACMVTRGNILPGDGTASDIYDALVREAPRIQAGTG
jgi:hypothetical protein